MPPEGRSWVVNEERYQELVSDNRIWFGESGNNVPAVKKFLSEVKQGVTPTSFWDYDEVGHTDGSNKALKSIFDNKSFFDYPKPTEYIKKAIVIGSNADDVILDFFAGSGTTAHAVMELNAEDGGNRQSISVQMPELLDEKFEAYKAGYRTIADITRARINKVIEKLKAEQPEKTQDLACANFTLAPSNFKVWQTDLTDVEAIRNQLQMFQQAEKAETRLHENAEGQAAMLTELLLKNGLGALGVHAVSRPKKLACGVTIHRVLMEDDRQLWLCFEPYQDGFKEDIAKDKPAQLIMLNSCFTGSLLPEKADEQLSNLKLELEHLGIGLLVI